MTFWAFLAQTLAPETPCRDIVRTLDATYYKVRIEGVVRDCATLVAIGVRREDGKNENKESWKAAAERRELIAKEMTPEQIGEAQKLCREWKPLNK